MSLPDTQVINMYHDGNSCYRIARINGCSESSMYNRLKSLGVVMRSRSKANKIFPDFIFISLYNVGLSSSQVGRLLGIDASTVTKRLHSVGFPLRSRDTACRIRYSENEFKKYFMHSVIVDKLVKLIDGK